MYFSLDVLAGGILPVMTSIITAVYFCSQIGVRVDEEWKIGLLV